jgi:5-methylcytosine-specific restriction endonuclease McrA
MIDLRKSPRVRLDADAYRRLRLRVLERDGWRCQFCAATAGLEVHHIRYRSQLGNDSDGNLMTLCSGCHRTIHA